MTAKRTVASEQAHPAGPFDKSLGTLTKWAGQAASTELVLVEGAYVVVGKRGEELREFVLESLRTISRLKRLVSGVELNLLAAAPHAESQGASTSEIADSIGMSRQALMPIIGSKVFHGSPDSNTVIRRGGDVVAAPYEPNVRRRAQMRVVELPPDRLVDSSIVESAVQDLAQLKLVTSEDQVMVSGPSPRARRDSYLLALRAVNTLWGTLSAVEDRLLLIARLARVPVAELATAVGQSRQGVMQRLKGKL